MLKTGLNTFLNEFWAQADWKKKLTFTENCVTLLFWLATCHDNHVYVSYCDIFNVINIIEHVFLKTKRPNSSEWSLSSVSKENTTSLEMAPQKGILHACGASKKNAYYYLHGAPLIDCIQRTMYMTAHMHACLYSNINMRV